MNKYSFLIQKQLSSFLNKEQEFFFNPKEENSPFLNLFENRFSDEFCFEQIKDINKDSIEQFIQSLSENDYHKLLNILIYNNYNKSFDYLYCFRQLDFPETDFFYENNEESILNNPHIHAFITNKHLSFFIKDIDHYKNDSFQKLMFLYCFIYFQPELLKTLLDEKKLSLTCYTVTNHSSSTLNFMDDFFIFNDSDYLDKEKTEKINQLLDIVITEYAEKEYLLDLYSKKMCDYYDLEIEDCNINPKTMSLIYSKIWEKTNSIFIIKHIKDSIYRSSDYRYSFNAYTGSEEQIKNNYLEQRLIKEIFLNDRSSDYISDYLKKYPFKATSDYIYYDKEIIGERNKRNFIFFHEETLPLNKDLNLFTYFNNKRKNPSVFCGFSAYYIYHSLVIAAIIHQNVELLENVAKNNCTQPLDTKIISTCAYTNEISVEFFKQNKNLIRKLCNKPYIHLYEQDKLCIVPVVLQEKPLNESYSEKITSQFLHYNNHYYLYKTQKGIVEKSLFSDNVIFNFKELTELGISNEIIVKGFNLMEKEFEEESNNLGIFKKHDILIKNFAKYEKDILHNSLENKIEEKESLFKKRL